MNSTPVLLQSHDSTVVKPVSKHPEQNLKLFLEGRATEIG